MITFILLCLFNKIFLNVAAPQIIIPYYSYLTPDSPALENIMMAARSLSLSVIVKPDNIYNPDGNWTASIAALQGAGINVLGYITFLYGARPLEEVIADIDAYDKWPKDSRFNYLCLIND
jgi:hypothetical protein